MTDHFHAWKGQGKLEGIFPSIVKLMEFVNTKRNATNQIQVVWGIWDVISI